MPLKLDNATIDKWKLEELDRIIIECNNFFADMIQIKRVPIDKKFENIVINTSGKSLLTLRETVILCSAGYPDGALNLSRNLYEQFIIMSFLI